MGAVVSDGEVIYVEDDGDGRASSCKHHATSITCLYIAGKGHTPELACSVKWRWSVHIARELLKECAMRRQRYLRVQFVVPSYYSQLMLCTDTLSARPLHLLRMSPDWGASACMDDPRPPASDHWSGNPTVCRRSCCSSPARRNSHTPAYTRSTHIDLRPIFLSHSVRASRARPITPTASGARARTATSPRRTTAAAGRGGSGNRWGERGSGLSRAGGSGREEIKG